MTLEKQVDGILKQLLSNKNVLLLGAPATGKSKIMAMVADRFMKASKSGIALEPTSDIPFRSANEDADNQLLSPERERRKVISITFHQGTKHRQFVSGIIPRLLAGESGFRITKGVLLEANEFAINEVGASLLSIDEINRGPAVSIFGDTLTAVEPDKRLSLNDTVSSMSASFQAYDDKTGDLEQVYLSPHVYILASMNEADTSVEPLDIAFLRRFAVYRLEPDVEVAYSHFRITPETQLSGNPVSIENIYSALVKAWLTVNKRIILGRNHALLYPAKIG